MGGGLFSSTIARGKDWTDSGAGALPRLADPNSPKECGRAGSFVGVATVALHTLEVVAGATFADVLEHSQLLPRVGHLLKRFEPGWPILSRSLRKGGRTTGCDMVSLQVVNERLSCGGGERPTCHGGYAAGDFRMVSCIHPRFDPARDDSGGAQFGSGLVLPTALSSTNWPFGS